jgi:hypothetical protein
MVHLAENEIRAHLEIMEECGDVRWAGEKKGIVQCTGTSNCLRVIGTYL